MVLLASMRRQQGGGGSNPRTKPPQSSHMILTVTEWRNWSRVGPAGKLTLVTIKAEKLCSRWNIFLPLKPPKYFLVFCLQDNLSSGVAGVTQGDYRMDGKMELITATTDGESKIHQLLPFFFIMMITSFLVSLVRGYLPAPPESQRNMMDLNTEQETLRELSSRKQNLLLELKNYEANQNAGLGNNLHYLTNVPTFQRN